MIDAKEAAKRAADYMRELLPTVQHPMLEEVEQDGRVWLITLSFLIKMQTHPLFPSGWQKEYKQFAVDATSGRVRSMKIRNVK
jgi:hypothetical protein